MDHTSLRERRESLLQHGRSYMNPDGTAFTELDKGTYLGGHITSFRRSTRCTFGHTPVVEEKHFFDCMGNASFRFFTADTDVNSMLMIKVSSGMSITHQNWFGMRKESSRMSIEDWKAQFLHQEWYYELLHELTRPRTIAKLGQTSEKTHLRPRILKKETRKQNQNIVDVSSWDRFHTGHADFYSDRSVEDASACPGFALTVGQPYSKYSHSKRGLRSPTECCDACLAAANASDAKDAGHLCTAFVYGFDNLVCDFHLGKALPPSSRIHLGGVSAFSVHAAARFSLYPKLIRGV
jgi:hypothetical protein